MPRRSSKDRDFATIARQVVEQAIDETMTGGPLPDPNTGKNLAAVALAKGGKARAAKLSPAKRKTIAKRAARARWLSSKSGS